MAYNSYVLLSDPSNYDSIKRSASAIKYIVIHYTANTTDTAKGNANYFTVFRGASAHYFVDQKNIYQSVPDLNIAWSVGGSLYTDISSTGGAKLHGKVTNSNSISIELCSSGAAIPIETQLNAIDLIRKLMKKYKIPYTNICRHFDVTGKHCPGWIGWFAQDNSKWGLFLHLLKYQKGKSYTLLATSALRNNPDGEKVEYKTIPHGAAIKCEIRGEYAWLKQGTKFRVTEIKAVGTDMWGKIKSGYWIPLYYDGKERIA